MLFDPCGASKVRLSACNEVLLALASATISLSSVAMAVQRKT